MVWYGAPPTPRQCVLSLRVVASCSVHPVSERHRQAVQSALVRRWVRPCDAGIGKEWNRCNVIIPYSEQMRFTCCGARRRSNRTDPRMSPGSWGGGTPSHSDSAHLAALGPRLTHWFCGSLFTVILGGYPTLGGGVLRISAPQFSMF
jgi:hypothetical protein